MNSSLNSLLFIITLSAVLVAFGDLPQLWRKVKYEVSLQHTIQTQQHQWYSRINPGGDHYLGAQPLSNFGHLEEIVGLGIDSVLVLQEEFERLPGWFNTPVNDTEWTQWGIRVKWIEARDYEPLGLGELHHAVEFLLNESKQGRRVYVHCKAGRGRSASVMIAFIMVYHGWSYDVAHGHIASQRPLININTYQRDAITNYMAKRASGAV